MVRIADTEAIANSLRLVPGPKFAVLCRSFYLLKNISVENRNSDYSGMNGSSSEWNWCQTIRAAASFSQRYLGSMPTADANGGWRGVGWEMLKATEQMRLAFVACRPQIQPHPLAMS